MRPIPIAAAVLATAGAMALAGWGLAWVGMAGPRAGARITTLVPQIEVSALFLVGLPVWTERLRAERPHALRHALAATWRGPWWAVWSPGVRHLKAVGELLAAGATVWVLACLLDGGPSVRDIVEGRLLLLAFAAFGISLGGWASAVWRTAGTALGACLGFLIAMAATPLAIAPVISAVGPRPALIQAGMLLNPWVVAAGVSGLDLLRMQWVYALSPLGSLDVSYPGLGVALALYGGAGSLLLASSARRLRAAGLAHTGGG